MSIYCLVNPDFFFSSLLVNDSSSNPNFPLQFIVYKYDFLYLYAGVNLDLFIALSTAYKLSYILINTKDLEIAIGTSISTLLVSLQDRAAPHDSYDHGQYQFL
jgi:hypothetical protein